MLRAAELQPRTLTVPRPPAGGAMLRNCLYLAPLGPLAFMTGLTGPAFACGASVATGIFATTAAVFFKVCPVLALGASASARAGPQCGVCPCRSQGTRPR